MLWSVNYLRYLFDSVLDKIEISIFQRACLLDPFPFMVILNFLDLIDQCQQCCLVKDFMINLGIFSGVIVQTLKTWPYF